MESNYAASDAKTGAAFKHLLTRMLHEAPDQRATVDEITADAWYNQEVYSDEEFARVMTQKIATTGPKRPHAQEGVRLTRVGGGGG